MKGGCPGRVDTKQAKSSPLHPYNSVYGFLCMVSTKYGAVYCDQTSPVDSHLSKGH